MNELFKKNCLTGETEFALKDLVEGSKKTRIKSIASRYGFKLSDKITKPQMTEDVVPAITANFSIKLKQYSDDELELMLNCMACPKLDEAEAEKILQSAPFEDGVIYMFMQKDKFTPCIPYELSGKLMEYCSTNLFKSSDDVLTRCAKACALIYGKFTPTMLINVANNAYKTEFTEQDAAAFLGSAQLEEFTYSDGTAICSYAEFAGISEAASGLDYDLPKKKEIDAYSVYGFDSTNYYYRQIVNFIYAKCGITYEAGRALLKNITIWCMSDGALPDIFKYIQQSEPKITADQFNFLLDMIGELSRRTRKWNLKGHKHCDVKGAAKIIMPQVQAKQAPETVHIETVHAAKKVGRNDPCPCGSGKKYKKCCGKNK